MRALDNLNPLRICVVGFGHAGRLFSGAVQSSDRADLVGIVEPNQRTRGLIPRGLDRFRDLDEAMLKGVDAFVISSPTGTHAELASYCVNHGYRVLVEKPAAKSNAEFDALLNLPTSSTNHLYFALHAAFGDEVQWFHSWYQRRKHVVGEVSSINQFFQDPYLNNPVAQKALGDAWLDSGPNAISVSFLISAATDFEVSKFVAYPADTTPILRAKAFMMLSSDHGDRVPTRIRVAWTERSASKWTRISFPNSSFLLDHAAQAVYSVRPGGLNLLFKGVGDRLVNHYSGVVDDFCRSGQSSGGQRFGTLVHRALLKLY